MNLRLRLHLTTALMAAAGTLILGFSEGNYTLMALTPIVSVTALIWCDLKQQFQLTTTTSNLAALLALAAAAWRLVRLSEGEQILAVADLMGYLQFILQFKPKIPRVYWLMAVVSFLEVSVGAALYSGLFFAVLMTVYMFIGLYFLTLFYLYREEERYAATTALAATAAARRGFGLFDKTRPIAPPATMHRDFTRRVFDIGFCTLAVAAVLFVLVPRVGQTQWVPTSIVVQRTVGFTPEINLNGTGAATEDPEIVLRAQFFDAETEEPYQFDGDLYLRGSSVSLYEGGRWRRSSFGGGSSVPPRLPADAVDATIRQRITIEPLSSTTLFSCSPAFAEEEGTRVTFNARNGRFDRNESMRQRRFSYDLLTTAFRRHRQLDIVPTIEPLTRFDVLLDLPESDVSTADPVATIRSTAARIVADIPASDPFRRAKALESYLRDSGNFQYTLDSPVRPDGVDPLEDFLRNNRRGHCEFFAGALALMLRSINIPARVVVGYHGGEWNVVGNFYQVRQLNAHSWVECYLPGGAVPLERLDPADMRTWLAAYRGLDAADTAGKTAAQLRDEALRFGAWLQLDATVAGEHTAAALGESRWDGLQQIVDYLRFLWNNYVVGLDAATQRESIYQPLVSWTSDLLRTLTDPETWAGPIGVLDALNPLNWLPDGVTAFSWRGGALLVGLLAALAAAAYGSYFAWRRWRPGRRAASADRRRRAAPPVEFYVRLETALAGAKLLRSADQTQREFIQTASGELAESPATRSVASLPRKIVEAFYRVRFGGGTLDDADRAEIDAALAAITAALAPDGQKN
jgi:transglutaminase-like putative cysteine protease